MARAPESMVLCRAVLGGRGLVHRCTKGSCSDVGIFTLFSGVVFQTPHLPSHRYVVARSLPPIAFARQRRTQTYQQSFTEGAPLPGKGSSSSLSFETGPLNALVVLSLCRDRTVTKA